MAERTLPCERCGAAFTFTVAAGRPRRQCEPCRSRPGTQRARDTRQAVIKFCAGCNTAFAVVDARRTYCSTACSSSSPTFKTKRTLYRLDCRNCGSEFTTRSKQQQTCSRTCGGGVAAGATTVRDCSVCGKQFESHPRQTCSRECTRWAYLYPGTSPRERCGRCYAPFARVKLSQRYCSRACRRTVVEARRRARKAGAPYELVVPQEIFERDRWTCRICDDAIDPTLGDYHPMMATLDHIVPIVDAAYPGHIAANLAAVHLSCNSRKRHRSLAAIRAILAQERAAAA